MSHKHSPIHPINVPGNVQAGLGMTLREYYAGLAMQGLVVENALMSAEHIAKAAKAAADALIEELNK